MTNTFAQNIIPANEAERLKAMRRYQLLEGVPEGYFANMAHIIAQAFDAPIALVSLVAEKTVTFPGNVGMPETKEVPRGLSLCSLAILDEEPTIFTDALEEPCLLANPLVHGEFGLRFYAGAPIVTNDGYAIGTVCIVAKEPRTLSEKEEEMLKSFARSAMEEIELRHKLLQEGAACNS